MGWQEPLEVEQREMPNPRHQYVLGADQLESSLMEKDLRILADIKLTVSSIVPLRQRQPAALGGVLPTHHERRSFLLPQHC